MSFKFKIIKGSIPYRTTLVINKKEFIFDFKLNSFDNRVYIDLYDNKLNPIAFSEPIIFGVPLWYNKVADERGNFNHKFPKAWIIANTRDKIYKKVTFDNIDEIELLVKELN